MRTDNGGQDREIDPARRFVNFFPLEPQFGACKQRRNPLAILSQFGQYSRVFVELAKLERFGVVKIPVSFETV